MKTFKHYSNMALFSALFMMTFFMGGCDSSSCEDATRPAVVLEGATPPSITSTIPTNGAINVPINTVISATFSEEINPDTVNAGTFTVIDANGEPIPGMVSYGNNNTVMIFTPDNSLGYNTAYTATITTDVTDVDGNALDISNGLNVWSFTTINEADVVPPTVNTPPIVISTIPADGAIDVPLNRTVSALLSKTVDGTTVDGTTFTLHNDTLNSNVSGAVSYLDRTVYFNPNGDLNASTTYTATITTDVKDTDGLNLNDSNGLNVWSFTTGTAAAQGPDPVILGKAGDFAILTQSGITNVPTSAITGDIGSSPITAAAMNTVTCAEVTGFIYGVNAAYTGDGIDVTCYKGTSTDKTLVDNAVRDMGYAYTDAATRTAAVGANLNIGAGTLNSATAVFAPGLYTWGSNVTITDSITLNGNADDTWIFQISGNLILASGAQIILGPNVQAKNIVWQVAGTNVTIGTGAQFNGIVLAKELIAVQTGASVNGRLLAQTEVTLDQTVITQPAP